MKHLLARKRGKLLLAVLIFIVLGVPAAIILSHWANSSSSQTIHIDDTAPIGNAPAKPEYQPLQTVFFSTEVPKTWHIQGGTQANGTTLQEVAFAPSSSSGQVGFTSDVLSSDRLAGVGDYHLRTSDPTYTSFTDPSFPAGSQGFKSVSGPLDYTVFLVHGNRYASISITNESSDDQALGLLKAILAHWVWL